MNGIEPPPGMRWHVLPDRAAFVNEVGARILMSAASALQARANWLAQTSIASRQVFFLVCGTDKRAAIAAGQSGAALPASRIRPVGGVDVFLDQAAAPSLD